MPRRLLLFHYRHGEVAVVKIWNENLELLSDSRLSCFIEEHNDLISEIKIESVVFR